MKNYIKWMLMVSLAMFAVLAVFKKFDFQTVKAYAEDRYLELQTFAKVLNLVQQYYVEEVETRKLIYGGIKGMLRELDPHTNFLPPEIFKEFESETSGEFGGLGIEISLQSGVLTIISPIEDAPAWVAGIKAGDKIIAVNNISTKGMSLVEAAQLMRGKKGSEIKLSIIRGDSDVPKDFMIKRGNVKIRSVKYTDFQDGYAYIKITSFIENTFKDLEIAIEQHVKKYGELKGLIIDLRRNPGGLLDQAIKVSDLFLDSGNIVSTIGRDKNQKEVVAASARDKGYVAEPLVILINEYSASASEIVAGALQDNQRALIVGVRSFGKGSVQSVVKLGDGSGLKLTVARYYTPKGRSIQAEGIDPDLDVENVDIEGFKKAIIKSDALREKDMEGHLLNEKEKMSKIKSQSIDISNWWRDLGQKKDDDLSARDKVLKTDYQAYQAFNYLKAWKVMKNLNLRSTK